MTAPESSPLGSAKPAAAAIAREIVAELYPELLTGLSDDLVEFTLKVKAIIPFVEQAAAIQGGDGQTTCPVCDGGHGNDCACSCPPYAKPNETSGATPRSELEYIAQLEHDMQAKGMEIAALAAELSETRDELNAVRAAGAEASVEFVEVGLDGRKIPHTTDAKVWASEFVKTITANPSIASDIDTMLGWFANAMCAQMDESERRHAAKSTPGVDAVEAINDAIITLETVHESYYNRMFGKAAGGSMSQLMKLTADTLAKLRAVKQEGSS